MKKIYRHKIQENNQLLYFYFHTIKRYNFNIYFLYDDLFRYFLSKLITCGEKGKTYKLFFKLLYYIKLISRGISPLFIFRFALYNCRPLLYLKKIETKKSKIYIPFLFNYKKQVQHAILFLLDFCKKLKLQGKSNLIYEKLAICILNAFFKQGPIFKKLYQMYKFLGYINERKRINLVPSLGKKFVMRKKKN